MDVAAALFEWAVERKKQAARQCAGSGIFARLFCSFA